VKDYNYKFIILFTHNMHMDVTSFMEMVALTSRRTTRSMHFTLTQFWMRLTELSLEWTGMNISHECRKSPGLGNVTSRISSP
jgi:hypothetical protein